MRGEALFLARWSGVGLRTEHIRDGWLHAQGTEGQKALRCLKPRHTKAGLWDAEPLHVFTVSAMGPCSLAPSPCGDNPAGWVG